ncbi:hypothetical protein ACWEPA_24980 [Streptomyces filamentosus]
MIKNMLRGSAALLLALTPLTVPSAAVAAPEATGALTARTLPVPAPAGVRAAAAALPLADAVDQLPIADESRTGYTRDKFKHWNAGLDLGDGCDTRVICTACRG